MFVLKNSFLTSNSVSRGKSLLLELFSSSLAVEQEKTIVILNRNNILLLLRIMGFRVYSASSVKEPRLLSSAEKIKGHTQRGKEGASVFLLEQRTQTFFR